MNTVPLLFADTVARLCSDNSLRSLKELSSGHFGNVGRSFWKKRVGIVLNVVYNPEAGTFEYCLRCDIYRESRWPHEIAYTKKLAHLVFYFQIKFHRGKHNVDIPWTTAAPSDPTLRKWLRAPFAQTYLYMDARCPAFLELLPKQYTFNNIYAQNQYSEALDAIIQRSQEAGRLELVMCNEFFKKRGRNASINWILTNKRLVAIWNEILRNVDIINSALTAIGVPKVDTV